jgi:putative flippase GtrA
MNAWIRWGKFNLVGALGMGLQLLLLALFNRVMAGHYLYASAIAIEITLLHNFAWHWNYTWRDRRSDVSKMQALLRFQFSNGLISMLGNLALMEFLVHQTHLPLLVANIIAILCCSIANFYAGNGWAFVGAGKLEGRGNRSNEIPIPMRTP